MTVSWLPISLRLANGLYEWGWRFSILGAIVTALSVGALWLGTRVRDRDFESRMVQANADSAKANERAGFLELQAAELNREAEQARLEQERLKAQLAWRVLPADDLAKLHSNLTQHEGVVEIVYPASDTEAQYLALQIARAFESTRWQVGLQSRQYSSMLVFGLLIIGPDTSTRRHLRDSFTAAHISYGTNEPPPQPFVASGGVFGRGADMATIFVGSKPPPVLPR